MYQNNMNGASCGCYGGYSSEGPSFLAEKREIKKAALYIGIPFLALIFIMSFWIVPYLIGMRILGFSQYEAIQIAREPGVMQIIQIAVSTVGFVIPFFVSAVIYSSRLENTVAFGLPQKNMILPFFMIGLGICAFSNVATSISGGIFRSFGFDYKVPPMQNPEGLFGFLLSLLATAVFPALVEEFACRGVVMGLLMRFGEGFAIVVSSVLFGAMHGNFNQIPFAVIVGLILGFIRAKTGSVWICILIHFTNNCAALLLTYLADYVSNTAQTVVYLIYLVFCMTLTFVGIQLLSKFKGDFYSFKKAESVCAEKDKYKWFFTSVPIVVFIAIIVFRSLKYLVI